MTIRTATALAAVLALAACGKSQDIDPTSQFGPNPNLPAPARGLLPNMHIPSVVGWGNGGMPTVAPGFKIEKMAADLNNPRNVLALPNGDILVVLSTKTSGETVERPKDPIMGWMEKRAHGAGLKAKGDSNRIVLLRDTNGDGKPEIVSDYIDGLNAPFGIVLVGTDLYIADTDAILRFPYTPGATKMTAPPRKLTDLPAGPIDHHWTKSLTASPDGSKLFVGVGSNSNIMESGLVAEKDRASIWEVDRATGFKREYATGLRNPNGLTFYPGSNTLWAVVNERDELGPNLVPDYMTSVTPGAFYGWPYSYWGQNADERVHPQRPDLVKTAIKPDYSLSSHVAPLSLVFDTSSSLPTKFTGGAFVAEHGSWNRNQLNGYRVVFIKFQNGKPVGNPEDFVWDFVKDGKTRGRPVGMTLDKTGALIIADDAGNSVWRVSYAAKPFKVTGAQQISF